MNTMNPRVDRVFFSKPRKWQEELEQLRAILLDCGLTEELKWEQPCYTFEKNNIAIIGEFKDCCILSFFKGALLNDAKRNLSKPGENTQAGRVIRFTDVRKIVELEPVLKDYIYEAVEIEKAGLKVDLKPISEHQIPEEFQNKLDENLTLKTAFEALTPGRQRAYLLHFSQPKQSKTRESRIEKCTAQILSGKGLYD
jgi:uncharacterized protein YdeI (YjbR/CyaY-like superfamily)